VVVFPCRTQAAIAGAVTMLRCLPEKLNPVIKPLMESIKKEEDEQLQVCWDTVTIMCQLYGLEMGPVLQVKKSVVKTSSSTFISQNLL
jgi:hypothetical protein